MYTIWVWTKCLNLLWPQSGKKGRVGKKMTESDHFRFYSFLTHQFLFWNNNNHGLHTSTYYNVTACAMRYVLWSLPISLSSLKLTLKPMQALNSNTPRPLCCSSWDGRRTALCLDEFCSWNLLQVITSPFPGVPFPVLPFIFPKSATHTWAWGRRCSWANAAPQHSDQLTISRHIPTFPCSSQSSDVPGMAV